MTGSDLGTDLRLAAVNRFGFSVDLDRRGGDLTTISGWDNLCQAIWLRLNTPMGQLEPLGHPEYGSRLCLVVGQTASPQTVMLAETYVREALEREGRVAEILSVDARPAEAASSIEVRVRLKAAGHDQPMNLALTVTLEPGLREG